VVALPPMLAQIKAELADLHHQAELIRSLLTSSGIT
jgi:hypothetical protein